MTTKTLFRWHLWLGVATGVFMFLIGGSGAIAVFIEEIDWLVTPALRARGSSGGSPASMTVVMANVRAAYPGDRVTALHLSNRPSFAHVAKLQSKFRGALDVFIDPATGQINGDRVTSAAYTSTLRNFIRQIHLRLLMGLWGRVFVGVFGVTLVLSCLTGLWIYRGWWKNFFRLRWFAAGPRTRWSDLHKLIGVWSLIFNILVGITGAVYGYENLAGQIRSHWLRPAAAPKPTEPRPVANRTPGASPRVSGEPLGLDALLAHAREAFPDLTVRNLLLPANASAPIVLRGDVPNLLVQQSHVRRVNFISLDPHTGAVLRRGDGRDAVGWDRIYSAFDPLHFGYFGGLPTKIIWFILGLAPSALALTGAWLWWRRTQGRPKVGRTVPGEPGALDRPKAPIDSKRLDEDASLRPSPLPIALAMSAVTILGAYVLVARDQGSWLLTGKLIEHAVAKPLALALTAFPVTGLLAWLVWRTTAHRLRFIAASLASAAWYLSLVTLFQ